LRLGRTRGIRTGVDSGSNWGWTGTGKARGVFLGDLNDIAVHEDRITAIANRRGQSSRRRGSSKRAFAAGLLTGREDAHLETVAASASDAHAALVKIKPFWR
jgi:hypothetical protein